MLITSSAERNAKYRREQELKRAMFALGNPTVDQKYITDFGNSASKFISDSAKGVSGVAFGQSQQALDRYNAQAQRLKYQKLVIEDFLERNAEKGSYTELQNALNNIQKGIDNVGNAYINTHNMMSQYKTEDEYNRDKITSQHVGSTYDEILAEINRLGEEQKKQTPEQATKTQKSRDVLNNLLYNNNYIERDSYQKAIADIDRQITALEGQINVIGTGKNPMLDKYYVGKEEENKKKRDRLNYLYTVKSTLEEKEKITEFTELPAKLGEHNFQIGVSNGKIKGQYNPTADQLKQWVQKYADSSYDEQTQMLDEKPEIVDPLGFVEQNPDLWAQEGQNSQLSNIFLTEIYNHAKEYHWDEITPEEKDIYYFTLNRLGKDKAMEYLSLLERYFGQRYAADITKSIEEFTDKAGWLGGTFINIALIPVSMIGNAEAALIGFRDYVSGEGINPYSSANRLRLGTTAIRSGTAKEWGKAADWELFGKNVFEQSFNILMSTGESLFGGLALGPAYMFFAGSGAAMSTAQDIYDRGGSANQIFFGALASGIAEAVFEKISIDRLLSGAESITGFKEMFKQILIQGGVEASEEVLTEMANTISDNLIMAEKSTVSLRVKELMDENPSMTPTEARKKAETEVVTEVIWAGLSGFISGGLNIGVIGTTGIVANKFDQKKQSVATQQIIGNQLKSDGTAEAFINFAISQGLAKDGTTVDSLSSEALGKVYQDFCDKFYETASKSKTPTELLSVVEKYNTEETPNVVKRYVGAVTATVLAEHPEWAPETSEATTVDVDGVVDDSAGGVEASEESVLPNVSAVAPEADPIKDDAFAARGLERSTEEQRFLKSIGETLGRKVEFRNLDKWVKDPETGKRRRVSPGGMINKTTGVIYLNSSKYANQNALREVLKHEITHFAEVDTEAYALLQKGIMDSQVFKDWVKRKGYKGTVNEDGYAVSATSNMNAAYIKRYAESGLEGTEVFKGKDAEDAANREMVADFVAENLFTDKMSRLRDALSDVQPEAVNKFKQWILDLLKKLKNAFRSQAKVYASIEGIEREFVKVCKSAQRIWEQNHQQTAEQQKNNEEGNEISPDTEGVTVNAKGEPVAHSVGNGTVQFSTGTFETDGRSQLREYLEKCVSSNRLTQAEMDEMLDGIEEIYNICKEFKDKYAPFGSWSDAAVVRDTHGKPVFSVVTPNGEYKMNLDFSLVCKKRRTLDAVFNLMADEGILDEFELGQKSIVKINEIIRKYGFETACSLCFVDAKRFRQADVADSFVNLYNELVESLVPESERDSISRFDFSERGLNKEGKQGIDTWDNSRLDFSHLDKVMKEYGSKTVEHKAAKYIKSHPEARKLLIRGEFMSSKDFGNVKTKAPEIMKLYNSKKGTGGPKAAFGDVQYLNEIIKKARNWTPNKAYMVGGVRVQSFSDYVPRMIFDYVQMIYDLAATKLPAHAYTKEVLFVKQFGLTGIKINMSLIPAIAEDGIAPGLDKNGNYVWAGESFDYDAAMEIQNAEGYSENCGTIAVGVSKEHILKLLRDPNIRMVIPYHKSGLNPIVAHMNKIDAFTDYTTLKTNPGGCQNTIDNKTGSAVKNDFNFNKALHDMGENGSPKAVAKQYLDWCAENDYMPKFAEFSKNANYYKLLEDFNLYDKSGKYAPQREVRAVFPTEGSAFGSMKELIKQGLEEDAIVEGKRNEYLPKIVDEIKRILPKTEAEISEEAVEQATTDLEADFQYSLPQEVEEEYMSAVESGDTEAQSRLVEFVAKNAGFPTKVMHGTRRFGFTKVDVSKSDDKISFFATDSLETAGTYSQNSGVRRISTKDSKDYAQNLDKVAKNISGNIKGLVSYCNNLIGEQVISEKELSGYIDNIIAELNGDTSKQGSYGALDEYIFNISQEMVERYYTKNPSKAKTLERFEESKEAAGIWDEISVFNDAILKEIDSFNIGGTSGVYELFANTDGHLIVECDGSMWDKIKTKDLPSKLSLNGLKYIAHGGIKYWTTRSVVQYAKDNGYTGVTFKNLRDSGNGSNIKPATVYAFFNPQQQLKSADPVTYDDEGNVIPVLERFNPQNERLIYSLPEAMSQFDALPFAKEIVEKYGKTTMSTDDIAIEMGKALSSISHGQWAHAIQIAQEIAETFEGNKTKTITNTIYNGLVRERESFLQDRAVSKPKERLASEREENRDLKKSKKSLEEKVKRRDNTLASIEIKHVVTEDRRKNIGHFHSVYNRLATRLKGNTDAKHIPEHLKGFVASFLEIFDLKSAVVDGTRVKKTFTSKDIAKFIREYTNTETDNFGTPNMAYDESIKEFLEYLYDKADTEDGVSVPELDAYDIMMLSNLADNVMQIVKMSEETFRNGRAIEFEELSDPCFADLKDKKQKTGWRNAAADWFRNLAQKNMTPPYFFKQLGEGFYRLYNDIVKGQGQWAVNFKKAQEFVEELKNKYNYKKWNKSSVTLKTERGDSIKLTIEQTMQLYATFKRQVSNTDQDAQHLNIGGIVLEDAISTSNWDKIKSDLDSIKNNSEFDEGTKKKKIQEVWNAFHEQYDSNAIPLTYNDLMSVQTLLSEDQRGYADGWVRYLSNNMAELGNQTSMMLFGYEKFHEQNYIPYNSAENYLYSQPGMATGDERIKHLSFTKNTLKGAATPLVLSSLSEVCASHVDKMCMYNAMAIPLENLNKVFNCKHYAEDGSVTANLRNDISKTFGPEAVKYLRQFIEDANGSVRGSSDEGFWDSLTSKFKKSAVLASMSVVIQQPSAMYRAMAYINPKYFTKLKDVKGFRKNYEQLCKYAPVALIKQMGRFDTGVGVGNVKWLLQDETLMDKLDDKASFLASYADEVTWGHIWTAVKAEAAAETDLQIGSEEFFKYCGQRFTEVINLTQVYDSTLVKSQHMRNKSTLAKMITSFMAEPTVTYNIIADALYRAKTEGKSGKKFAGRAVGAVLTSIIANVLLKSLVYAARDDEEDKNLIENYFKQVTQNFVDELNPFGFVPYFRDISSLWQGYDVNRADTTLIGDLINAIKSLSSENTSAFDKIEKLSGAIANAFGVPVRNVVRDIKAVINGVTSIFDNPVSLEGIKYAQKEGLSEAVEKVTGGLIDKDEVFSYYGRMVEAIEDGDEETYNEIYDLLIENGVSEDDIISEIKKAASVSRDVNQQVSSYVGEISRTTTYKSFDDEDRKKLKSKIQEALGVQKLDDIIPGSDSQFDKLYQAKRNNNTTYKKLKKQLIDRGFTENEIQLKLFLAELRYIESKGIDIHEWALAEIAKSKKYADTDGSGGVSKKESYQAIKNLDVDTKAINALIDYYKLK